MTKEEQTEMFNTYYMAGYPSRKASATSKPTYADLERENAELKLKLEALEGQIEKMKCCENCSNYHHRIDHRCNTKCKNLSEWEIKEK